MAKFYGQPIGDSIDGTALNDLIFGGSIASPLVGTGDDTLNGGDGNDTLNGGDGNDSLDGQAGKDVMVGGSGNDTYVVDSISDKVSETLAAASGGGLDTVQSTVSFKLGNNIDNLTLTGTDAISGAGNGLANELTGNDKANKLSGLAGNDSISGNDGADTLDGGTGDDSLSGGEGDDLYIVDSAGDDLTESGASTGDEMRTNQLLSGAISGIEHYTFTGSKAVAFTADAADNRIAGTAAADSLDGGEGKDTLSGLGGNDTLVGGNDDDRLNGGAGADSMIGGAGDDTYVVDNAGDKISDSGGTHDTVEAAFSIDLTLAKFDGIEDATLIGSKALSLTGDAGANILSGNAGANKINGGLGADSMSGGGGKDIYTVDDLGDTITEDAGKGTGVDLVMADIDFTLDDNIENLALTATGSALTGTGNDLANIITGNGLNNTLSGEAANDILAGNLGDDSLVGGAGVDKMAGGKGNDSYSVTDKGDAVIEGANAGTDKVVSSIAYALGVNLENLTLAGVLAIDGIGNVRSNEIVGNDAKNKLTGLAGNDSIDGGIGDDTLSGGVGNDVIEGGVGTDVAVFAGKSTDYEITTIGLVTTVRDLKATVNGNDGVDAVSGVEILQFSDKAVSVASALAGSAGDDSPALTAGAENYDGVAGDDTLQGLGGDDSLAGNDGDDVIVGGLGDDLVTGGAGSDRYEHGVGDGFDTVVGADSDDVVRITGSNLFDINFDRIGDDLVVGPAINSDYDFDDTGSITLKNYYLGDAISAVEIDTANNLLYGTDPNIATFHFTTDFANGLNNVTDTEIIKGSAKSEVINGNGGFFDELNGGSGNDTIRGGSGVDSMDGNQHNDILFGFGGNDQMRGGAGNDTLNGGDGTDEVSYRGAGGGTVVDLSVGRALDGTGGKDVILNFENVNGSNFGDKITGNAGANLLHGRSGNDTLIGGGGNDTLEGGAQTDTASYEKASGGVTVDLAAGTAVDTDVTGNSGTDTLNDIERIRGSEFADKITGSDGDDTLDGGGGNDSIAGGKGYDFMTGGKGNDTLDGGSPANDDTASYEFATKGVIVNLSDTTQFGIAAGTAQDGQGGTDTLLNIVGVYGSKFADTIVGSDDREIFQTRGGNDSIIGGGGGDALDFADSIDGVTVDLSKQGVAQSISASNGKDTFTGITQAWGSSHNDVLIGDDQDNFIQGRDGNDKLVGGAGFDDLEGGAGNDTMSGGIGSDTYEFSLAESSGQDLITDFVKASDSLSFFDVVDENVDGKIDVGDVNALITGIVNGGAGKDVTVTFENGATILFQGAGTAGAINGVEDLVADPATQILINSG